MSQWGYIHKKKEADSLSYKVSSLEKENKKLKEIVKKLLAKEKLSEEEQEFCKSL